MNGDGMIDAGDLAYFTTIGDHPSADFTHNGVVDDIDRRVLSFMIGREYSAACYSTLVYALAEGCVEHASPDINGDGEIDASDFTLFNSGDLTLAEGDFNGDGVIDTLDELLLIDRLGTRSPLPNCGEVS